MAKPKRNQPSLYIHVPFCRKKCAYCAFYKQIWTESLEQAYLRALECEINAYQHFFSELSFQHLFIGGGTPSVLSPEGLAHLFQLINQFSFSSQSEKTIEMNPESVTTAKLAIIQKSQINRISLGVQSLNENELKQLGRIHTVSDTFEALSRIQEAGFNNINLDLIFGLPASTPKQLQDTINHLLTFGPTHFSMYALSIEEQTRFFRNHQPTLTEDEDLRLYQAIQHHLKHRGFHQYEVSAFARPGYQCQHNLGYWQYQDYIGLGPAAHSFWAGRRFANPANLNQYLAQYPSQRLPSSKLNECHSREGVNPNFSLCHSREGGNPSKNNRLISGFDISHLPKRIQALIQPPKPTPKAQERLALEYLITGLRLLNGISIQDFKDRFGIKIWDKYQKKCEDLLNRNLIQLTKTRLRATRKGLYLLDSILETLSLPLARSQE